MVRVVVNRGGCSSVLMVVSHHVHCSWRWACLWWPYNFRSLKHIFLFDYENA